jgi:hypothetical protein
MPRKKLASSQSSSRPESRRIGAPEDPRLRPEPAMVPKPNSPVVTGSSKLTSADETSHSKAPDSVHESTYSLSQPSTQPQYFTGRASCSPRREPGRRTVCKTWPVFYHSIKQSIFQPCDGRIAYNWGYCRDRPLYRWTRIHPTLGAQVLNLTDVHPAPLRLSLRTPTSKILLLPRCPVGQAE